MPVMSVPVRDHDMSLIAEIVIASIILVVLTTGAIGMYFFKDQYVSHQNDKQSSSIVNGKS